MATGPEHYREAERMYLMSWENDREPENVTQLLACAQVHATLAQAAATALAATNGMPGCDSADWFKVVTCATGEEVDNYDPAEVDQYYDPADAAETAMSATERFEHDQADEAKLDAEAWGQDGASF